MVENHYLDIKIRVPLCLFILISVFIGCEDARKLMVTHSPTTSSTHTLTPPQSPLIALTPNEFNNTISDLLDLPRDGNQWPNLPDQVNQLIPNQSPQFSVFGQRIDQLSWPWEFPKEVGVHKFEGMADGQVPSPYLIEQIQKASLHFASYTLVSPIFFTCEQWNTLGDQEAERCAWYSILRFVQRAWRRPLSDLETQRLEQLWQHNLKASQIEASIVLSIAAILQSPHFLYKVEHGKEIGDTHREESESESESESKIERFNSHNLLAVNDWEMASRLSYFLWDSMPDSILFEAASQGKLSTIEQIKAQSIRMLDDPKARTAVLSFHRQLLETESVRQINPARRAHAQLFGLSPMISDAQDCDAQWPSVVGPIRASMEAESELFIERTIFDGVGTFQALMTDHHGYMSDVTAFIYGEDTSVLPLPSVTYNYFNIVNSGASTNELSLYPVEFPSTQRAGLLTLPSVLAVHAYPVHPAPILRGKMILERFACQSLGIPPPDAEAAVPPDVNEAEGSNRERTHLVTSSTGCSSCHTQLNPPGFAFENYDVFGRWRDTDNEILIDATGSFTLQEGETFTFTNGVDLAYQLAESTQVQNCYVNHWTQYAVGYEINTTQGTLISLQDQFRTHGHIPSLLVSITTSDLFRYLKRPSSHQPVSQE
jgi:hypothetical protein